MKNKNERKIKVRKEKSMELDAAEEIQNVVVVYDWELSGLSKKMSFYLERSYKLIHIFPPTRDGFWESMFAAMLVFDFDANEKVLVREAIEKHNAYSRTLPDGTIEFYAKPDT